MTTTFLEALVTQLRDTGAYNRNDQIGPAAILWPDEQRQWGSLLPLLQAQLPISTLGDYDPDTHTGPAYWLRCVIASTIPDDRLSEDDVPIIYLPGYGRHHLRALKECPKLLRPLAELQYRGTFWLHRNGRDWTVAGFLHSLDVPLANDNETKEALGRALPVLAQEPLARLRKHAPLDAAFLNELLHPDAVRQVLLWLSDPAGFRKQMADDAWRAFRALCRQRFALDPIADGLLSAVQHLSEAKGEWATVWQRYIEAPESYPGIPDLLEYNQPQQLTFLEPSPVWPQSNRAEENRLRDDLQDLKDKLPDDVRKAILKLEDEHSARRTWVWARLGLAPLATALKSLTDLAQLTAEPLDGASVMEMAEAYTAQGWKADRAVLDALAAVQQQNDVEAIQNALLPLYEQWLQREAKKFQQAVQQDPTAYVPLSAPATDPGACIIFADALRYDVGQRLAAALNERDWRCTSAWGLAALPTVTDTAKPAVSPANDGIQGSTTPGVTPVSKTTGARLTAEVLRRLLQARGWQTLSSDELGDPTGRAWTEAGAIDSCGHQYGWRIAHHVRNEVRLLADRAESLLEHGWKQIIFITDHGWLMLPGGLPKADMPIHLTEMRKGRCAVLKIGAQIDQPTVAWHWNPNIRIAVAPGICCYEAGKEYEHGGISPQECVVPIITVTTKVVP